jgi:O-antigen/teichoic acid export membrane protein
MVSYFWSALGKWVARFIGIISTLILVRILSPDDFGIAAQSIMVVMFFDALSQTGADKYIIQLTTASRAQLNSAWTFNLVARSIMTSMVFLFSDNIANFLNEDRLSAVLKIACFVSFIGNFISPGMILLKKEFKFKAIANLEIIVKLLSFIVTMTLAFWLANYWALIWANIFSTLFLVFGSYIIAPIRPQITFAKIAEQWRFSRGIFFMTVLGYIRSKADIFIISHKFGSTSTGYYSLAQEFSQLPYTEVIEPVAHPLYSSLAKVSHDLALLEAMIHKFLSVVYLILVPSIFGIVYFAEEIVSIIFGNQWAEMAPIFANLSILMMVFATNGAFKHIFTLRSKFNSAILLDIIGITLIVSAIFIDDIHSSEVFSIYRVIIGGVIFLASLLLAKYTLKFKITPVLFALIIPTISSILMLVVIQVIQPIFFIDYLFLNTFITMLFGAVIYSLSCYLLLIALKDKLFIWTFNFELLMRLTSQLKSYVTKCFYKHHS